MNVHLIGGWFHFHILNILSTSDSILSVVFYFLELLEEYEKQTDTRSAFMKMEELQMGNMILLLLQKQTKPNIIWMNENKIHWLFFICRNNWYWISLPRITHWMCDVKWLTLLLLCEWPEYRSIRCSIMHGPIIIF